MPNATTKGPVWGALGVVLTVALMQLLRFLDLPDTPPGIIARSLIQAAGVFLIVTVCLRPLPARRFFLLAVPLITAANFLWPPFQRGLSQESQQVGELVTAMTIGVGLGGIFAIWWMERRRDHSSSEHK